MDISRTLPIAASSSLDAHIRLWDLENGKQMKSIDAGPGKNSMSRGDDRSPQSPFRPLRTVFPVQNCRYTNSTQMTLWSHEGVRLSDEHTLKTALQNFRPGLAAKWIVVLYSWESQTKPVVWI